MCFNKAWTLSLRRTGLDRFKKISTNIGFNLQFDPSLF